MRNPRVDFKAVKLALGLPVAFAIALTAYVAFQVRSSLSQAKSSIGYDFYTGSDMTTSGVVMQVYKTNHPRMLAITEHIADAVQPWIGTGSTATFGQWRNVALKKPGAGWEPFLSIPYHNRLKSVSMTPDGESFCVLADHKFIEVRDRTGGLKERHNYNAPWDSEIWLSTVDCNNRSGTITALASDGVYITAIGQDASRDRFFIAHGMNTVTTSHLGDLVACDNSHNGSGGNASVPDEVHVCDREARAVAKLTVPWHPRRPLSHSIFSELRFSADDKLLFLLTKDGILYRWRRAAWGSGYEVLKTPFPCTAINPVDEDTLYVGGDGVVGVMGTGPGAADSATTVAVPGLRWIRALFPKPSGISMLCIDENTYARSILLPRPKVAP